MALESTDRERSIIQTAMDGFWQADMWGRLLAVNDAYCRMSGYSEPELLGMHITELEAVETEADTAAHIQKVIERGEDRFQSRHRRKDGSLFDVELSVQYCPLENGPLVAFLRDITERKRAEEALLQSNARLRSVMEVSPVPMALVDEGGDITFVNPAIEQTFGYALEDVPTLADWWLTAYPDPEYRQWVATTWQAKLEEAKRSGTRFPPMEVIVSCGGGTSKTVLVGATLLPASVRDIYLVVFQDITERKRADVYREMGIEALSILGEPGGVAGSLQRVVALLKARTGFDAVGIRLRDGDDFPYSAQQGFSDDFLMTENMLVERSADGKVCRDKDGNPCLACTCGLVIAGKTPLSHPLFTRGGSFWTNDSIPLLDLPPDQDLRYRPRNQCMVFGYASMALVPIRDKDRIVGLIHLNDRRKGCFSAESVELLEAIAGHVGAMLTHRKAEERLAHSHSLMSYVIEHCRSAIAVHDRELRYVYVSQRYLREYNVEGHDLIGKHHYDVFPDLPQKWRDVHQKALAGEISSAEDDPYVRKDGTVDWTRWECRPWYGGDGSIGGIIVYTEVITERKQAEEALRQSEALLSNALQMAHLGHWEYDVANDLFTFNDQFYAVFHTTVEQVGGYTMPSAEYARRFVHPDDMYMVGDENREAIRTADPHFNRQVEHRVIFADGTVGFISVRFFIVKDSEGRTIRTYGVNQDITERKRAESALRQSDERFRNMADNSPLSISVYEGVSGRFQYMNKRAVELCGYTIEDIPSVSDWYLLAYPDEEYRKFLVEKWERRAIAAIQAGSAMEPMESVVTCKDGSKRIVEWGLVPAGDTCISYGLDLTERRQMEGALRESEEIHRRLFTESPVGVVMVGTDSLFRRCNPAFCMFLGYAEHELIGRAIAEVTYPEDRALGVDIIQGAIKGDPGVFSLRKRYVRRDGRVVWGEVSIRAVRGQGRTPMLVAVVQDIDQNRQNEDALRASEERLRQSEKMEAIGQLAGGVAHDFNNQLGGIMNYADLLLASTKDENLVSSIEGIIRLCTRSADLTAKLLAFSRKGKYQVVPVDVHATVAEVVSILGHSLDRRIRIRQRLDANPPTAIGDPTQFQNMLLNLGLNARDAMPEGGELVFATDTVALDREFCGKSRFDIVPGDYLKMAVSDSGTGMDEETQARIFEPFFTTKEQGKGTGMGLPSVYGTVVNHHGAIQVDSKVGQGTTMTVYLPLARQAAQDAMAGGGGALVKVTVGARILIVDDEESVREVAGKLLRKKGYEVVTAKNGGEGVEYYRESWQQVDLVIVDMNMPVLNGRGTFAAMRQINPGIRAILATGYGLDSAVQQVMDEGVLSHIQKPFRSRDLVEQIERALTI